MSTHRAEIDHFVSTVKSMGGTMTLGLDEKGYVDNISVHGLKGMKDLNATSPIAAMEALRPVVGPTACKPSFSKEVPGAVGLNTATFTESQGRCYGGLNVLVNMMKSSNKLWEGEKFAAVIQSENPKIEFYCLDDGDLVKFNTIKELDSYQPQGLESNSSLSY